MSCSGLPVCGSRPDVSWRQSKLRPSLGASRLEARGSSLVAGGSESSTFNGGKTRQIVQGDSLANHKCLLDGDSLQPCQGTQPLKRRGM